ncbi:ribosomal protein S18-alanine N-acetyltransferase [Enterovirga aerilata]|uniref:Ribosomal protein S18-alanine N-acetyltransferase n=1 Tax=Enterovirga aerilata TaxID=2730920 RepID=A0A849I0I0_9HYPH|nr:ribosomal protein S18-alanine N-acetyltransferase [Enterovirga sp. DB1703]NNM71074.1 ribosomal protein S18-alanine N-acetyltransferase [Enterovirga sp. DB1703]
MSGAGRRRTAAAIRPAEPDDVPALLAIEEASFPTDRLDRRALRHAVRSPTILARVAADGDEVLGYVLVQIRRGSDLAWLTSVAVAPGRQGDGLGRRLVDAAERAAREAGRTRIRLEVRADNEAARKLYERAGYRRIAVIPDYYEDGAAAWRYEKDFSGQGRPT